MVFFFTIFFSPSPFLLLPFRLLVIYHYLTFSVSPSPISPACFLLLFFSLFPCHLLRFPYSRLAYSVFLTISPSPNPFLLLPFRLLDIFHYFPFAFSVSPSPISPTRYFSLFPLRLLQFSYSHYAYSVFFHYFPFFFSISPTPISPTRYFHHFLFTFSIYPTLISPALFFPPTFSLFSFHLLHSTTEAKDWCLMSPSFK